MKVGFIGLGNMGVHQARNVLRRGFELHVYNRTPSKAVALASEGASVASSPAELARRVDIVLACLADVPASEEVFLGEEGVMSATRPEQLLVDHSTVDPDTSRKCYQTAKQKGANFLDAPISGGPTGAEAGTLTIMAGGDPDAFENALPVFQAMGQTIAYMGGSGCGTVTKLANQLLVSAHTLASCEALLLGIRAGVDAEKLTEVLMSAWGGSKMLERNAPFISHQPSSPSNVPIRNLLKDLEIIVAMGERMGLSLPSANQACGINRVAANQGMALNDITAIARLLEPWDAGRRQTG